MSDFAVGPASTARRGALRTIAALLGGAAAWAFLRRGRSGLLDQALAATDPHDSHDPREHAAGQGRPRKKWAMAIDLDRCTGCGACATACRAENNIPVAGPLQREKGRAIFWMDMISETEGEYPDVQHRITPMPCNHCEDPPCIKVCPVGATGKTEDGIIYQMPSRCIGCRMCANACPYERRYFNWSHPEWPKEYRSYLNPDVATRTPGVMEKCTFCHHRIRKAQEIEDAGGRKLTDQDAQHLPACAQSCPAEAIVFGDLNDPESAVSKLEKSPRAFRQLHEIGTHPKVIYLREAKWQE